MQPRRCAPAEWGGTERGEDGTERGEDGTERGEGVTERGEDGTERGEDGTEQGEDGTERGAGEMEGGTKVKGWAKPSGSYGAGDSGVRRGFQCAYPAGTLAAPAGLGMGDGQK